jgi:hypothetical protein
MDATEGLGRGAILAVDSPPRDAVAVTVAVRHRKKDGSLIDVELMSVAITLGGTPAALISIVQVTYLGDPAAGSTFEDAGGRDCRKGELAGAISCAGDAPSIDLESPPPPATHTPPSQRVATLDFPRGTPGTIPTPR